jgi:hypothetical protein
MARVIIRLSMDSDKGPTHTYLANDMRGRGAERLGTGAYELDGVSLETALQAIESVIARVRAPEGSGHLDHLWLYVDRTGTETAEPTD